LALALPDNLPMVLADGPWQRFHLSKHEVVYYGRSGDYRFDDPKGKYGILYAGEDVHGAFAETFLRNEEIKLIERDELKNRLLAALNSTRHLRLVDLTGEGLQRAGVEHGRVYGDEYARSQRLSRELYEHPDKPDGIRYRLVHDLGRIGVALFEPGEPEGPEPYSVSVARERGSLIDPHNADLLGSLLEHYDKYL
jgi:hypothetical protein